MLASPKILFLDDEPDVLRGFQNNLRKTNFDIYTAFSAEQAFDILKKKDVDIVVSDECMPNMPGHKFLTKVGQDYPTTVRLLLSGQAGLDEVSAAINDAHIFKFLMKPTKPNDLIIALNEAVAIRQLLLEEARQLQNAVAQLKPQRKVNGKTGTGKDAKGEQRGIVLKLPTRPADLPRNESYNLVSAIRNKDLSIHFQSIVDPVTLKIVAYEASPIWYHPDKGVLFTADILDQLGTQLECQQFGDWLLEEVCKKKLIWKQKHDRDPVVLVKLNDHQIISETLLQKLERQICDYRISSGTLVLGISEAIALTNNSLVADIASELKERNLGAMLYNVSSLTHSVDFLLSPAFDLVKIDCELIQRMLSSEEAKSQVKILIDFAHDMNMQVIAEGAEDPMISKLLMRWGCEYIQGGVDKRN